jgi:hypothetical protein
VNLEEKDTSLPLWKLLLDLVKFSIIIVFLVAYMNWNIENKISYCVMSVIQWNVESAPLCGVQWSGKLMEGKANLVVSLSGSLYRSILLRVEWERSRRNFAGTECGVIVTGWWIKVCMMWYGTEKQHLRENCVLLASSQKQKYFLHKLKDCIKLMHNGEVMSACPGISAPEPLDGFRYLVLTSMYSKGKVVLVHY